MQVGALGTLRSWRFAYPLCTYVLSLTHWVLPQNPAPTALPVHQVTAQGCCSLTFSFTLLCSFSVPAKKRGYESHSGSCPVDVELRSWFQHWKAHMGTEATRDVVASTGDQVNLLQQQNWTAPELGCVEHRDRCGLCFCLSHTYECPGSTMVCEVGRGMSFPVHPC